jgi:gp16 family phage-associated protein
MVLFNHVVQILDLTNLDGRLALAIANATKPLPLSMENMPLKTRDEIRAEIDRNGTSVSGWAANHHISRHIVEALLNGKLKGRRG